MIELLQMQWDAALIASWRAEGDMRSLTTAFMDSRGITPDILLALRRTPRCARNMTQPTRCFVGKALPLMSDWLFNHEAKEDHDLLFSITDSKLDTQLNKRPKPDEFWKEERRQRQLHSFDQHKGHRRSDWGVCK